jgi:YVTN family beta-propeller protein
MFARHRAAVRLSLVLSLFCLAGCATQELPDYPPAYRAYAYVTNGKSNNVSVIDLLTLKEVTKIPVGKGPTGVAANSKKNEVYVVNTDSATLSVIDAERNQVVATIPLHSSDVLGRSKPFFVDVSEDGKRAVVANSGSNNVSVLDLDTHKTIATVTVGRAPGLAKITPDGKLAVVANRDEATVSVIDLGSMSVRSTVSVCSTPEEIAIVANPQFTKAFVTCSSADQIAVVALATDETQAAPAAPAVSKKHKQRKLPLPAASSGPDKLLSLLDVGKTPIDIAVKPDAGEVFVSNFGSGSVSEVITGTNEVSSTHLLGQNPVRSVVSADNSLLYTSSFGANSVSIYSIDDGKLLQTIQVGSKPDALAFTPDQRFLLVADSGSGDVAVIRRDQKTGGNVLFTMVPVGLEPRQIAIKDFMLRKPPQPATSKP